MASGARPSWTMASPPGSASRASVERPTIHQLTEDDAEAYRALRLHLLQVAPDAYGATYAESVGRPIAQMAERLRMQRDPEVGFTLGAFAPDLVGMVTVIR